MFKMFLLLIMIVCVAAKIRDPATDQLLIFKAKTPGPIGTLTTTNGEPVSYADATNTLNTELIDNNHFMELQSHLNRERTPERLVHAKGTGGFGYFVTTRDISNICRAKFLSKIGKKTPVGMRLSTSAGERGTSDLKLDARGFAVKFYTEGGNFDIAGFNTPMYIYNEPLQFHDVVHMSRRNPSTNLLDGNARWDSFIKNPHMLHIFILLYSGRGIPASYANTPGFAEHTYQVRNEDGDLHFIRFHFLPDDGIKNLPSSVAANISATDPDYLTREFYNRIATGNCPTWTLYIQIMTEADVKAKGVRYIFDVSRVIPLNDFPLHEVGKVVINRNPKNFFAEIEQMALCPGNLVDGIEGGPDKLFESRRFAYRDAQLSRLGVNFNKIPVNCPYAVKAYTYNRDGISPVNDNEGDAPNYYPNSFHGPEPYTPKKRKSGLIKIKELQAYNTDQARELYENELTTEERDQLIQNLSLNMLRCNMELRVQALKVLTKIHPNLGERIAQAVNAQNGTALY